MFIIDVIHATLFLAFNLARLCRPLITHIARREMPYLYHLIRRTPPTPTMTIHQLKLNSPTLLSRLRADELGIFDFMRW